MEWFEQWFNTEYYHLLYRNRNDEEAQAFLTRLVNFLSVPKGSRIIDIACGRGRHSRFLSEMGHDVTGIDLSKNSIDFARKFEKKNLHFLCFDKRKTLRANHFDYAFNLFTSFGYLKNRSELQSALNSMVNNLHKDGIFVLDYLNSEQIRHQPPQSDLVVKDDVKFNIHKEVRGDKVVKTIAVMDGDKVQNFSEEVHLISENQFRELFIESGLKILHIFGNYQLDQYSPADSERMIFIGSKV